MQEGCPVCTAPRRLSPYRYQYRDGWGFRSSHRLYLIPISAVHPAGQHGATRYFVDTCRPGSGEKVREGPRSPSLIFYHISDEKLFGGQGQPVLPHPPGPWQEKKAPCGHRDPTTRRIAPKLARSRLWGISVSSSCGY